MSFFLVMGFTHVVADAGEWDVTAKLTSQLRYFPASPTYSQQKNTLLSPSFTFEPELVYDFDAGNDRLTFTPFVRWDADDRKRSHADIRELSWLHLGSNWDVVLGISKVYWGVTESVHLVDIINQIDGVEGVTGEDKLGQPMLNFTIEKQWGTWSVFILPGFRAQRLTANNARLHGPVVLDTTQASYASAQKNRHVDLATRLAMTFSDVDMALSYFQGTSREARFLPQQRAAQTVFVPHYDQIRQLALELQWTTENTLWKSESILRTGQGAAFYASATGFEHTFYAIAGSQSDVGFLLEYLYDGRDPRVAPVSIANHDIFSGLRWVLNDTQDSSVLWGVMWDYKSKASFFNIEAQRRINDHVSVSVNGRFFVNIPQSDPLFWIRNDDHIELNLDWFF